MGGILERLSAIVEQPGREEYLFFAWTFGDHSTYEKIAGRLIYNSTYDHEGQFFDLLEKDLPPGAIGESSTLGAFNVNSLQ